MAINKRYQKCVLLVISIAVIGITLSLNILYLVLSNAITHDVTPQVAGWPPSGSRGNVMVPFVMKDIIPQDDGKIDVVLSMDMKELFKTLDSAVFGNPNGEATTNPMPANFTITRHNPNICKQNPSIKWIIYVHTAPNNVNRRRLLRLTWANRDLFQNKRTAVVFLVGTPVDIKEQAIINQEMAVHGDIVQGSFTEHYQNLTLKGIMGLRWVSQFCPNAEFALKADDDAFINIFRLQEVVAQHQSKRPLTVCPLWKENTMPILRDPAKCMKWCVRYTEFPGKRHFPRYCAGLGFLMSRDIIPRLHQAALSTPFFWIDDVYVTGILGAKLQNINYVDLLKNFTLKEAVAKEHYLANPRPQFIFAHVKKEENFMAIWKATLDNLKPHEKLEINFDAAVQLAQGTTVLSPKKS